MADTTPCWRLASLDDEYEIRDTDTGQEGRRKRTVAIRQIGLLTSYPITACGTESGTIGAVVGPVTWTIGAFKDSFICTADGLEPETSKALYVCRNQTWEEEDEWGPLPTGGVYSGTFYLNRVEDMLELRDTDTGVEQRYHETLVRHNIFDAGTILGGVGCNFSSVDFLVRGNSYNKTLVSSGTYICTRESYEVSDEGMWHNGKVLVTQVLEHYSKWVPKT